jgi:thiol-disulfide isomerase/thioredoxin
MNLAQLKDHIYRDNEVTYIVNFWATWCAPCVKELPYFEEFSAGLDPAKAKVILVSLDFDDALEKRIIPFVEKKQIRSEVIHFVEEKSPNYWIPQFSQKWTGSIPATLVLNGKKDINAFFEQSFHSTAELEDLYQKLTK